MNTEKKLEVQAAIKEINGIKFIEPQGFHVTENRIDQIVFCNGEPELRPFFHSPVFIICRALNVDTGTEEVEIIFKRDHMWKKLWIPKRAISDTRQILELSNHGLPVNSVNAKKIIEYLASFEASNIDLIKLSFVVKGVGWKLVRDRTVFVLDKMVARTRLPQDGDEVSVEFVPEAGFERFARAMKPEGDYHRWREYITEALRFPLASFAFYASFAAPLLRLLRAPNFIIDYWGNTSLGKTTVLEVAASIWGNPHKEAGGLVFSWDSTKVFLERIANFFSDLPIFPDDSQTVDDRTLRDTLYLIANGVGRGRGSLISIRHNPTWHTVCYSSGERPLTQCTTFAGAKARTIEICGSPFPGAGGNFVYDLKQGVREHYGHAGPKHIFRAFSESGTNRARR
jgi:uncharacterized protein (DUF927 family)